jgi:transcriptional regulator GlxA family with amidase domain
MLAMVEARLGSALAGAIQAQFLVERARAGAEPQRARPGPPGHTKLEQAVRVMEAAVDSPVQAAAVARAVGLSPRQLERQFRRHLGHTPAAYAAGLRLDRARTLLRETGMSVTAVAAACGYVTPSRFSAAYRGRFGRSPREDRSGERPVLRGGDDAHQPA